jgi:hypothetical protein
MGRRDHTRHPAAFYVTQRKPADWLHDDDAVLVERFKFVAKAPRLLFTLGTWRKTRRKSQRRGAGQPNGRTPRQDMSDTVAHMERGPQPVGTPTPCEIPLLVAHSGQRRRDERPARLDEVPTPSTPGPPQDGSHD